VYASVGVAQAQSIRIADATIQKAAFGADARVAASMQRRGRYRAPCDRKQRAKAGAVIGFVAGMVIVNRIAADYDSSAGFKATLAAGGYGAAMGAWLGVATCR
jgi:Zn-dependent protease